MHERIERISAFYSKLSTFHKGRLIVSEEVLTMFEKYLNSIVPDSYEIAQRASATVRFQDLSGIRFEGAVTYRDLMSALLMSQRDLMYASVSKADKLRHCIKMFTILDAYIDAQRKISANSANEIVICCDNLKFAADYIIDNASNEQKDELRLIYNKILNIALQHHESATNIRHLVRDISAIR